MSSVDDIRNGGLMRTGIAPGNTLTIAPFLEQRTTPKEAVTVDRQELRLTWIPATGVCEYMNALPYMQACMRVCIHDSGMSGKSNGSMLLLSRECAYIYFRVACLCQKQKLFQVCN